MVEKLTKLFNAFIKFHDRIGVRYITMYVVYALLIISALNWKSILTYASDTIDTHKREKHLELLLVRDSVNSRMNAIVNDLRSEIDADRIFIIEYHNTVSNLRGIPFKFMSLTVDNSSKSIDQIDINRYSQLNTGLFTSFITDLKEKNYIELMDIEGGCRYPNICTLLREDKAKNAAIILLPGVEMPLGFLMVEWTDKESSDINWNYSRSRISRSASSINALLTNLKSM